MNNLVSNKRSTHYLKFSKNYSNFLTIDKGAKSYIFVIFTMLSTFI